MSVNIWNKATEKLEQVSGNAINNIDDANVSRKDTWSSEKISAELAEKADKSMLSNPNLLDNPWFTVNQRGVTTFTGAYGLDRWRAAQKAIVDVNEDGSVTLKGNNPSGTSDIYQYPENWKKFQGKTYTLSAILDGQLYSATFEFPIVGTPDSDLIILRKEVKSGVYLRVMYIYSSKLVNVSVAVNLSNTVNIKAVKLETGSVSTLANDIEPDYATELAKCQRYYQRITSDGAPYSLFGYGIGDNSTEARVLVHFATPMRKTPTLGYGGTFELWRSGEQHIVTSIGLISRSSNSMTLNCISTGLTANSVFGLRGSDDASVYIEFSADM